MKIYRLLATLLVVFLIKSDTEAIAQESNRNQTAEVVETEFEMRSPSPCYPFQFYAHPSLAGQPVDDQGNCLPINQCKTEYLAMQSDRCGFSTGLGDHLVSKNQKLSVGQEIDLSPMNFDCMQSGCEFEYANSARNYQVLDKSEKLGRDVTSNRLLSREEVRRIIATVFSKELAIDETVEDTFMVDNDFNADDFEPYVDPNKVLLISSRKIIRESKNGMSSNSGFKEFWSFKRWTKPSLVESMKFVKDSVSEVECRLCGSLMLELLYGVQDSIDLAQLKLDQQKEVASQLETVKAQAMLMNAFAHLLRGVGESMIQVSDSISTFNIKKVEARVHNGH